jgi:hypothetical protein
VLLEIVVASQLVDERTCDQPIVGCEPYRFGVGRDRRIEVPELGVEPADREPREGLDIVQPESVRFGEHAARRSQCRLRATGLARDRQLGQPTA